MKDDRLRIPVDVAYVEAIGRATYVFATLEWNVIWCCERLQPGCIRSLERKTAGGIANKLLKLIDGIPESEIKSEYLKSAIRFQNLVQVRNDIMHGNPATSPCGQQFLYRNGSPWTMDLLNKMADDFFECSQDIHKFLSTNFYG